MKKQKYFTWAELILRVPTIIVFIIIVLRCIIEFDEKYESLLILLLGAAGWENILFVLQRIAFIDVVEYWKKPDSDGGN